MELRRLLEAHRNAVLDRWFDVIAETYPRLTCEFLGSQKDQFRNPVGHAIKEAIGPIYDELTAAMDREKLLHALDGIIRIRSVQEFSPSEALAFIFDLKTVLREEMAGRIQGIDAWSTLADLEARIDRLALLAFEKYTECREQLHEIRHKEIRSRTLGRLNRNDVRPAASECSGCLQSEEEIIDDDV